MCCVTDKCDHMCQIFAKGYLTFDLYSHSKIAIVHEIAPNFTYSQKPTCTKVLLTDSPTASTLHVLGLGHIGNM